MAKSVPIRDRSLNFWNHWQDMDGEGFPSATELGEEFGESRRTVTDWLEPLRPEWEGTIVDSRTGGDCRHVTDKVGERTLSTIRNIPGLTTEDRIDLVRKVAEGEETRSSIRDLKKQVEESDSDVSDIDLTEEVSVQQEETEPTETDQQIAESTGTDAETVAEALAI